MLVVGKIVGFHGLRGEVKLTFSERLEKNLEILETIYVFPHKMNSEILEIESFRVHKTNILLKFKGYNTKSDVEHLKGALLKQEKDLLAPLENEEYFIDDLIGMNVLDEDEKLLGDISAVYTGNASNDVLELKLKNGKETLIPFIEEFVPKMDFDNNYLIVKIIPGLIDD